MSRSLARRRRLEAERVQPDAAVARARGRRRRSPFAWRGKAQRRMWQDPRDFLSMRPLRLIMKPNKDDGVVFEPLAFVDGHKWNLSVAFEIVEC